MPVINIRQGQPYISVRIAAPGPTGGQLIDWERVRLVIIPPPEPRCELPLSPQYFTGFWPGHDLNRWHRHFIPPEEHPVVVYPAFGLDDDGAILFRFDSKIEQLHGRYLGRIETLDGHPLVDLDLDIGLYKWVADDVKAIDVSCGGTA